LAGSWAGAAAVVRRAAAESGKVPAVWSKTANKAPLARGRAALQLTMEPRVTWPPSVGHSPTRRALVF
jgi:hypothetical protein